MVCFLILVRFTEATFQKQTKNFYFLTTHLDTNWKRKDTLEHVTVLVHVHSTGTTFILVAWVTGERYDLYIITDRTRDEQEQPDHQTGCKQSYPH